MKKHQKILNLCIVAMLFILAPACIKNNINIEVVENGCKWLNIRNDSYDLLEQPCETGKFSVFTEFEHKEDTNCIHWLKINPVFYNEFNQPIQLSNVNKAYLSHKFSLRENIISFNYSYTITNQSTPQTKVNYAVLTYLVESERQDQSNSLSRRFHFPCTVISDDDYTYVKQDSLLKVDRSPGTFSVDFWDHASEDGDLISAYLNGKVITLELQLYNAKKRFDIPKSWLNPGLNDLAVFALNQGSSGPNTVSLAVNGVEVNLGNFAAGLKTGNAVKIDF